jgi:hypothetical protein
LAETTRPIWCYKLYHEETNRTNHCGITGRFVRGLFPAHDRAKSGVVRLCTLQLQFFLGDDFLNNSAKRTSSPNLVTKFEAK